MEIYQNFDIIPHLVGSRRGDRAAECTGLENRRRLIPSVGSNPTLSATFQQRSSDYCFFLGSLIQMRRDIMSRTRELSLQ